MTKGERATAVLNYLEECDGKTILRILDPYLSDEALSDLYFWMKRDGFDLPGDEEDED